MKPERQGMSGAKSSVSGIGMGVKFGWGCLAMVEFMWCMSNSCVIVVVLWVVVSPYFPASFLYSKQEGYLWCSR